MVSASWSRSPSLRAGRRRAGEGCGPKRASRSDPHGVRVLLAGSGKCGGRASASSQAWWLLWSLSPDPGCAHPAAAPQAHRWLRGGHGCLRPRKELANSLGSQVQFPSPCFSQHNRPCFRRGVQGSQRGAPHPHPPTPKGFGEKRAMPLR